MSAIQGEINTPVTLTAQTAGEWTQTQGPPVNLRVALDEKSMAFTPSDYGTYEFKRGDETFTVQVGPVTGDGGTGTGGGGENPPPQPPTTGLLWDSNRDGKWNDGNKREITTKQGGQTPDDKSIFVAASGSPKLIIDGNGVAHLQAGSGGCDNISLKGLCRHQEGGDGPNRGGGEGFSIAHADWDSKRERFHNEHVSIGSGNLPKKVDDNKWYTARFSWKHEGSGIRLIGEIDYNDGNGFQILMNKLDSNPDPWFLDKALNAKNSYFWIRLNNSAHGRIYVMAINWDAQLTVPFMFEPAQNSIALKDVQLAAI